MKLGSSLTTSLNNRAGTSTSKNYRNSTSRLRDGLSTLRHSPSSTLAILLARSYPTRLSRTSSSSAMITRSSFWLMKSIKRTSTLLTNSSTQSGKSSWKANTLIIWPRLCPSTPVPRASWESVALEVAMLSSWTSKQMCWDSSRKWRISTKGPTPLDR